MEQKKLGELMLFRPERFIKRREAPLTEPLARLPVCSHLGEDWKPWDGQKACRTAQDGSTRCSWPG
jgi:hypothetical protein